jgi:hypothetical protein
MHVAPRWLSGIHRKYTGGVRKTGRRGEVEICIVLPVKTAAVLFAYFPAQQRKLVQEPTVLIPGTVELEP